MDRNSVKMNVRTLFARSMKVYLIFLVFKLYWNENISEMGCILLVNHKHFHVKQKIGRKKCNIDIDYTNIIM